MRAAEPAKDTQDTVSGQDLTEAERFRIIHHLITSPTEEGGAGVTPKEGRWKNVESIFPLHDHTFNKEWIKKSSTMTFLKVEDLDEIRNRFGEKVSYWPVESRRLGADLSDCLLLRFHPKLLCLSHLSRGLWFCLVGHPWLFLSNICTSERAVVRDSGGVLETTGT